MASTGDTGRSRHAKFDLGMMRDIASWELPEGACYDAVDMLCDMPGKIRKRGGYTSPSSSNRPAAMEYLVSYKSGSVDGLTGLYGSSGKGGLVLQTVDRTTGAANGYYADGASDTRAARPFQYYDLIVFPFQAKGTTTNDRNVLYIGGGGTQAAGSGSATFAVTAGDNRVTGLTGAALTSAAIGDLITFTGASAGYIGRIIEVTSSTAVRVSPTPLVAIASAVNSFSYGPAQTTGSLGTPIGDQVTGRYGVSFQGRIVLGYTLRTPGILAANYAKGLDFQANRLVWTYLPTETVPGSTAWTDGINLFQQCPFAPYNYLDIPSLGGMTGLAAVGDGQLAVFGPRSMFRVSGQLATETVANNSFSFSVDQISNNIGCVSNRSIQYARGGLMWAGYDNIYEYDGSSLKPLLNGRNARYFQARLRAGDTVYGSAYWLNRNHYYLSMSGSDGGLLIDCDNMSMTRLTNMPLFDSTPDPDDATILWGIKWWDPSGAAPTVTKGPLWRLDPIFLPAQANSSDGDGTAVLYDTQTASYVNGSSITNTKLTSDVVLAYDLRGTGSPTATVKMDTKLNTSDAAYVTVTSTLPNTGAAATSTRMDTGNLLPDGPAIETRITGNAACASFELLSLDFGTQQRPEQYGAS